MSENQLLSIDSSPKTIQACFRECLYQIPSFQRPYSWGMDQLNDYWNDVVLAQSDFFFGSTVTWISEERPLFHNTYSVIDGQQRLSTSAIALSVVRDAFTQIRGSVNSDRTDVTNSLKRQERVTQGYLVAEDDHGNQYPIVKRRESPFWENIQQPDSIPSAASWDQSTQSVKDARKFFEDKITAELGYSEDSVQKQQRLIQIRENILSAKVIQVELRSEEDAFLIFETLNTRGAELKLSDLVKNMLVRSVAKTEQDRDAIDTRWTSLAEKMAVAGESDETMERFIWQSWNSRRTAVKETELYKEIKRHLQYDSQKWHEYLNELEEDARIFQYLNGVEYNFPTQQRGVRNALAVPQVKDGVRAMNIFNVSVANSALMALIRKFDNTRLISQKQLIRAVKNIECFHFQFSQLTSSSSTGGTRQRYNAFAVKLTEASSSGEVDSAVQELSGKLRESLPSRDLVAQSFGSIFYAPNRRLTRARRKFGEKEVVRYVLASIGRRAGSLAPGQETSGLTIEHIKPQSGASNRADDVVYSIGNLTLLTESCNSSLGDQAFAGKRRQLDKCSALRDDHLVAWLNDESIAEITTDQVRSRVDFLTSLALDKIWSIN